eukprot:GHVT01072607.1.p1 GENE.GHVT01072607.1~~GHVT01072607.1.p1  ORF type:complete len:585 (+),score=86.99 GHVT01072607.1:419-2173(+)
MGTQSGNPKFSQDKQGARQRTNDTVAATIRTKTVRRSPAGRKRVLAIAWGSVAFVAIVMGGTVWTLLQNLDAGRETIQANARMHEFTPGLMGKSVSGDSGQSMRDLQQAWEKLLPENVSPSDYEMMVYLDHFFENRSSCRKFADATSLVRRLQGHLPIVLDTAFGEVLFSQLPDDFKTNRANPNHAPPASTNPKPETINQEDFANQIKSKVKSLADVLGLIAKRRRETIGLCRVSDALLAQPSELTEFNRFYRLYLGTFGSPPGDRLETLAIVEHLQARNHVSVVPWINHGQSKWAQFLAEFPAPQSNPGNAEPFKDERNKPLDANVEVWAGLFLQYYGAVGSYDDLEKLPRLLLDKSGPAWTEYKNKSKQAFIDQIQPLCNPIPLIGLNRQAETPEEFATLRSEAAACGVILELDSPGEVKTLRDLQVPLSTALAKGRTRYQDSLTAMDRRGRGDMLDDWSADHSLPSVFSRSCLNRPLFHAKGQQAIAWADCAMAQLGITRPRTASEQAQLADEVERFLKANHLWLASQNPSVTGDDLEEDVNGLNFSIKGNLEEACLIATLKANTKTTKVQVPLGRLSVLQ